MKYINLLLALLCFDCALGQVDFSTRQIINDVIVYQDSSDQKLFYYVPNDLRLAKTSSGKPDFKFVRATYTGERDRGDYGTIFNFHQLAFTLEVTDFDSLTLVKTKQILAQMNSNIELQKLPLSKMKAALSIPTESGSTQIIQQGFFEHSEEGTIWTKRRFSMNLDLVNGKLLWDAFHTGNSLIGLVYGYYAKGIEGNPSDITITGDSSFVAQTHQILESSSEKTVSVLVHANVLSIAIDTNLRAELMKNISLNHPGLMIDYPVLSIIYDDFLDEVADDLWEYHVEVKAHGFGGKWGEYVDVKAVFSSERIDDNLVRIYFDQPIRTDKPFYLRVTQVNNYGYSRSSEWVSRRTWGLLDLSSSR